MSTRNYDYNKNPDNLFLPFTFRILHVIIRIISEHTPLVTHLQEDFMTYSEFISEIKYFWHLRGKGLKKQANSHLSGFARHFRESVPESSADAILCRFCREYIDELKYPGDQLPRRHLPFQISELLRRYLTRECAKNHMPQMRWACQLFGNCYDPENPDTHCATHSLLERAYAHEACDQETVELFFGEQLSILWWGQHHFPDTCLITPDTFRNTVRTAGEILSEKYVSPSAAADLEYYVKLYQLYFTWDENGRDGEFDELCRAGGLDFSPLPAYYIKD